MVVVTLYIYASVHYQTHSTGGKVCVCDHLILYHFITLPHGDPREVFRTRRFIKIFRGWVLLCKELVMVEDSPHMAEDSPHMAEDSPNMAEDSLKIVPTRLKIVPTWLKIVPTWLKIVPTWLKIVTI